MKYFNFSFLILGSVFLTSCQNQQEITQSKEKQKRNFSLGGKIFVIGPSIDTANARAYGECDCCMSQVAFLNDSIFISINECMFNNGYYKGRYRATDDTVELISDPLYISAEADKRLSEEGLHKVRLIISRGDETKYLWTGFNLMGKKCYKTDMDSFSFATQDTINLKSFFANLKSESDSISQVLGIDF